MTTNNKKIRTIFMGTPQFAVDTLSGLIDSDEFDVVGVFTAPDRPAGRGRELKSSVIKKLAVYEKIDVFQPEKIRQTEWIKKIKELQPDVIVVAAYGQIIPQSILDIPKYDCINVHASLLPKYRGASPIHMALYNGEKETGVTIMKMDAGMDTGSIIESQKLSIKNDDNLSSLHDKLSIMGAELLIKCLPKFIAGEIKPVPQNDEEATYTQILKKKDGKINWSRTSQEIVNMIRGFNPWPGTFTEWEGKCLKILSAQISERDIEPGKVTYHDNHIYVGTKDGAIEVLQLQLEGRNCLIAPEFIKGCSMLDGYFCK